MKFRAMSFPELMLIVGTRAALGVGLGFLLADRLNGDTRRGAGWALVAVGALTTIPLAAQLLSKPPIDQGRPI